MGGVLAKIKSCRKSKQLAKDKEEKEAQAVKIKNNQVKEKNQGNKTKINSNVKYAGRGSNRKKPKVSKKSSKNTSKSSSRKVRISEPPESQASDLNVSDESIDSEISHTSSLLITIPTARPNNSIKSTPTNRSEKQKIQMQKTDTKIKEADSKSSEENDSNIMDSARNNKRNSQLSKMSGDSAVSSKKIKESNAPENKESALWERISKPRSKEKESKSKASFIRVKPSGAPTGTGLQRIKTELIKIKLVNRFISHHTKILPGSKQKYISPDQVPPGIKNDDAAFSLFKEKLLGKGIEFANLALTPNKSKSISKRSIKSKISKASKRKSKMVSSNSKLSRKIKSKTSKSRKSQNQKILPKKPPWIKFVNSTNPHLKPDPKIPDWNFGYALNSKRLRAVAEFEDKNRERLIRIKYCQKKSSCRYAKNLYKFCEESTSDEDEDRNDDKDQLEDGYCN